MASCFYPSVDECRFFQTNSFNAYTIPEKLPKSCQLTYDFGHYPPLLAFKHKAQNYLLGVNDRGLLVGFSENPQPGDKAQLCILKFPEKPEPFIFTSSDTPESAVLGKLQMAFTPTSGNWHA